MKRGDLTPKPKVLLNGLGIPESPRWHNGRLWFCNWIDRQVVAVGLDGKPEVMLTRDPDSHPMGYSIDWTLDGRLLVTGDKLRRQEPDGSMTTHAGQHANEIVVDGRGNIYLNGADFNFVAGEAPKPGYIQLVTPDGELRQVAGDIQFPNGMVITPDNRTLIISESFAGRLTAFDIHADGSLSNRAWAERRRTGSTHEPARRLRGTSGSCAVGIGSRRRRGSAVQLAYPMRGRVDVAFECRLSPPAATADD